MYNRGLANDVVEVKPLDVEKGAQSGRMDVEEYKLGKVSKEGHVNNASDGEDPGQIRLERRHTLSSSFRYLKRQSKVRRLSFKHTPHSGGPHSPGTPGSPNIIRRQSLAGTFSWDPRLSLPKSPTSFVPDGERQIGRTVGDKPPPDVPYDPYNERIVEHPTTNTETLLHLLKGSLGTGILAMPNAFYHSGWAIGVGGTILIGMICTYCIHLLVTCEYELCRRRRLPALNYPSTAEAALLEGPTWMSKIAPYSGHIINGFLLAYQLGICCIYVVFVASNIKDVVDNYWTKLDVRIYMVMLLLPLILINYIRNLKYLAPFSSIANVITFVGFGITLYYVFIDLPSISERDAIGPVHDWPLFFGTVLFSLEAIGVIMPLENEMETPKSFGGGFGVLNKAMAFIVFLYVGMGFVGYLKYGAESAGSITLNLPKGDMLAQSVKITMALAIFITHALQCYVAIDITWTGYLAPRFEKSNHKLLIEYVIRTLIVLFTFLMAIAIPNLDLFISLIGALCLSGLGIAFPALIDQCTWWYQRKGIDFTIMCVRNILLTLFGALGLVVGTYTSLDGIVRHFSNGGEH